MSTSQPYTSLKEVTATLPRATPPARFSGDPGTPGSEIKSWLSVPFSALRNGRARTGTPVTDEEAKKVVGRFSTKNPLPSTPQSAHESRPQPKPRVKRPPEKVW